MKIQTLSYTAAVFLSAYLLFAVQPMIGKVLLPGLGGSPAIWNTTMLFFQILLLGGYLYAHLLTKLPSLRLQFATHIGLMIVAGLTLPMPTTFIVPEAGETPILWQLKTMAGMMAIPFLILSATAPMLQRWFSFTSHASAKDPYFLYAASNTGSILALVLYPSLVELFIPLPAQSIFWSYGFWMLICLISGICALSLKKSTYKTASPQVGDLSDDTKITPRQIGLWLVLAFVPSSLMLGLTSHITASIGAIPLFWVAPLTIYILSFIMAFSKRQIIPLEISRVAFAILFPLIFCAFNLLPNLTWSIACVHFALLFFTCLMCHQELVRLKPTVKHLTFFFLILSCGGALGGIFNAILAPQLFLQPHEYMVAAILSVLLWNAHEPFLKPLKSYSFKPYLMFCAAIVMAATILWSNIYAGDLTPTIIYLKIVAGLASLILIISMMDKRPLFVMACLAMAFANPTIKYVFNQNIIDLTRNYFGTLIAQEDTIVRILSHGDTLHGAQALDKSLATIPLSYYNPKTANGEALTLIENNIPHAKIAALGLGSGSVACLFKPDNFIDFYEIDANVVSIVETKKHFTYLSECKTPYKIIMGDARINMQKADDNLYDAVFVDVFSGDNIPMHLITKQAAEIYRNKTKKDGVVLFHISNRFFNLQKELGYIARDLNTQAFYRLTPQGEIPNTSLTYFMTHSVLFTNNEKRIAQLKKLGWKKIEVKNDTTKAWTDDFATPLRAITFGAPQ